LLAEGAADGTLVLGDDCPPIYAPGDAGPAAEGTVDLVVLAPSRSQRRDARWARDAASTTAARLSRTGIAYLVPGNSRRLRRALVAAGLQHAASLLNVPDVNRPRYLVPVGTVAERYALAGGIPASRPKRLLATGLGARGRASFGPTGAVHRREAGVPLAAWLLGADTAGSVLVAPQQGGQGAILYRFGDRPGPEAIAKVSPGADDELRALGLVAPGARDAGVRTPLPVASGRLGSMPYAILSFLEGSRAADLVARGEIRPDELQRRIADWLERWHRACSSVRPLTADDLERFVLSPGARAAADGPYLAFLEALCERAAGRSCPFVPVHGDLTLANVLVDERGGLGVVDWEHATEDGLPLTDLLYAGVDAVAARRRYADRPAAFAACFELDGPPSPLEQLRRRLASALELDEVVQALCFHACWLHHAANEADRSTGSSRGPFATILDAIARTPELFGVPRR
jgi:aminoglycoside phosphotransferase (APT) family kinase protein